MSRIWSWINVNLICSKFQNQISWLKAELEERPTQTSKIVLYEEQTRKISSNLDLFRIVMTFVGAAKALILAIDPPFIDYFLVPILVDLLVVLVISHVLPWWAKRRNDLVIQIFLVRFLILAIIFHVLSIAYTFWAFRITIASVLGPPELARWRPILAETYIITLGVFLIVMSTLYRLKLSKIGTNLKQNTSEILKKMPGVVMSAFVFIVTTGFVAEIVMFQTTIILTGDGWTIIANFVLGPVYVTVLLLILSGSSMFAVNQWRCDYPKIISNERLILSKKEKRRKRRSKGQPFE